jgi:hypothetical protein
LGSRGANQPRVYSWLSCITGDIAASQKQDETGKKGNTNYSFFAHTILRKQGHVDRRLMRRFCSYQALLARRLERMAERGFPFAMAQVLDTNPASLQNLKGQGFEVFNQYSVYEHSLPLPDIDGSSKPLISVRDINRADHAAFKEIERNTTLLSVLSIKGSADTQYFLSGW